MTSQNGPEWPWVDRLAHPGLFCALSELPGASTSILVGGCLACELTRARADLDLDRVRLLRSMAVMFDDTVSGAGSASFGAQRIFYALFHTTDVGVESRPASVRDSDYRLRLGWISFGTLVAVPDVGELVYWRAPIWI